MGHAISAEEIGERMYHAANGSTLSEDQESLRRYVAPDQQTPEETCAVIAALGETGALEESWWRALLGKLRVFLLRHGLRPAAALKRLSDADLHGLLVASVRRAAANARLEAAVGAARVVGNTAAGALDRTKAVDELAGFARQFGVDLEQLRREFAAVKARYAGTAGWMKAPNGKPTQLNETQWVMVRAPRFKAWFGDWESAWHQEKIDALPTVTVDWNPGTEVPKEAHGPMLREAERRYLNDERGQTTERMFRNGETKDEIYVSKTALRKATSGHAGVQKMRIVPVLPQLIEGSHFVGSAADEKAREEIAGYR
jgi:hypothetical protein